jgi:hypothetical protein
LLLFATFRWDDCWKVLEEMGRLNNKPYHHTVRSLLLGSADAEKGVDWAQVEVFLDNIRVRDKPLLPPNFSFSCCSMISIEPSLG